MSKVVELYTDGACKGNPGPGGWGVFLRYGGHELELCGGEAPTTNNRMELMAVIEGLGCLKRRCQVELYTDSRYVMQGMTQWIEGWKRNGWINSKKEPVKNDDLWKQLDEAVSQHDVSWHWVKGHSGDEGNEKADQLANQGIEELVRADA